MGIFESKFTNIYGDTEIVDSTPDAEQDWFYVSDYGRDHDYWQGKLTDIFKILSSAPSTDCKIIYGGLVTDSGSGQVDISEGVAIGKDTNGNLRLIHIPALTNVSLPSGYNDGNPIWVIGQYDFKLSTETRSHYRGTSYHYTLEDTYLGDTNSENTTSTDDMFTQSDPNGTPDTVVVWGKFTMSGGGAFASLDGDADGRTDYFNLEIDGTINTPIANITTANITTANATTVHTTTLLADHIGEHTGSHGIVFDNTISGGTAGFSTGNITTVNATNVYVDNIYVKSAYSAIHICSDATLHNPMECADTGKMTYLSDAILGTAISGSHVHFIYKSITVSASASSGSVAHGLASGPRSRIIGIFYALVTAGGNPGVYFYSSSWGVDLITLDSTNIVLYTAATSGADRTFSVCVLYSQA